MTEFEKSVNLFTTSVCKIILGIEKGNFLVSPFSAATVLGTLVLNGSRGETADELRNVLHLSEDRDDVKTALKSVLHKLKSRLYPLRIASRIYIAEKFQIDDEADLESVDFGENEITAKRINRWVKEHTNKKVDNLMSSEFLGKSTRAALINTAHFKADWFYEFGLKDTKRDRFYKSATEAVLVDYLRLYKRICNFYRCDKLDAQFLELPFQGAEASMVIVLPNEVEGLARIEENIEDIFIEKFWRCLLNVNLPKFKIESCINLKKVLSDLGATKCFKENEADFSRIAGDKGDLFLNEAIQTTFVDVSEAGVEATTPTFNEIANPKTRFMKKPEYFIADHPFIFYIKIKNVIAFVGRVTRPYYDEVI